MPVALAAYEYALALKPDSADARYSFALGLKQANFLADAANELQKVLARQVGCDPRVIERVEKRRTAALWTVKRIGDALGVSVASLRPRKGMDAEGV